MSFESDLVAALAGVAGGRVSPGLAPENEPYPLVNYKILSTVPLASIDGTVHGYTRVVEFECWAETAQGAIDTAKAVRAAIIAITGGPLAGHFYTEAPPQDYQVPVDKYMEPVHHGFFHAEV
ncbi:MAG: hypothetical protein ACRCZI_01375 [Cetobacterium sp.]